MLGNVEVVAANGGVELLPIEKFVDRYGVLPPGVTQRLRGSAPKPEPKKQKKNKKKLSGISRRKNRK